MKFRETHRTGVPTRVAGSLSDEWKAASENSALIG